MKIDRTRTLRRERVYTSRVLSHLLVNPEGEPTFVGSSFAKCLETYVSSEAGNGQENRPTAGAVAVGDFAGMMLKGWRIYRCTVLAYVSPDDMIKGFRDGQESDREEQQKAKAENEARKRAGRSPKGEGKPAPQGKPPGQAKAGVRAKGSARKKASPARRGSA